MDDRAETDEHILAFDIPDEALERAGNAFVSNFAADRRSGSFS
jgi:hypothetical protein